MFAIESAAFLLQKFNSCFLCHARAVALTVQGAHKCYSVKENIL